MTGGAAGGQGDGGGGTGERRRQLAHGDPRWIALEDDISSSVTEDDFSDEEE